MIHDGKHYAAAAAAAGRKNSSADQQVGMLPKPVASVSAPVQPPQEAANSGCLSGLWCCVWGQDPSRQPLVEKSAQQQAAQATGPMEASLLGHADRMGGLR